MQVGEERWRKEERLDEEAEERKAKELLSPLVDTHEKNWEGFEPDVEDGVDEADVNIQGEYDRLWKLSVKGRTRISRARSRGDIVVKAISGADMIDGFPVALRRRCARR